MRGLEWNWTRTARGGAIPIARLPSQSLVATSEYEHEIPATFSLTVPVAPVAVNVIVAVEEIETPAAVSEHVVVLTELEQLDVQLTPPVLGAVLLFGKVSVVGDIVGHDAAFPEAAVYVVV